jgi:hypothetical protein
MDSGRVRRTRDQTVEGIDLTDEMAFAQPADGWITGHRADRSQVEAEQRDLRATSRGRRGGFGPGMAAAYDDDIELHQRALVRLQRSVKVFHVEHHFPMQN